VSGRTLRRWLTEDESFKAEYDTARTAIYRTGISRIQAPAGRGVETLEELLDAKKFPGGPVWGRAHAGALRSLQLPHDRFRVVLVEA
jgi:hypothetical protein